MSKVDPCLYTYKTVICVVFMNDCLFWAHSKSDIDNVMKFFKEDGPSYNWEHSKGEPVPEFLGIDIRKFYDVVFQFYQTGLVIKLLESKGMDNCNGFPTPIKVEDPLGTYYNVPEAKRDCPNSFTSIKGSMLYLTSNTKPDIYFLFIGVPGLHRTPRRHMILISRGYTGMSKAPRKRFWCSICPRK